MYRIILILMALVGVFPVTAWADCNLQQTNSSFGVNGSFDVATDSLRSTGSGGLVCDFNLALLSSNFIYARAESAGPYYLENVEDPSQKVPLEIFMDSAYSQILTTEMQYFSNFQLIGTGGQNSGVSLFMRTNPANVSAGQYVATVPIRWWWAVCRGIGIGNACSGWDRSEGLTQTCIIICFEPGEDQRGPGEATTIIVALKVENDCVINAPDVEFGAAPLVSSFDSIQQRIEITCTKNLVYSVGLSDGLYPADGVRRMQGTANTDEYIKYDIYKGNGVSGERWGNSGNERVESAEADLNPGPADGTNAQQYAYTAKVIESQDTPSTGIYQDSVIVDVTF
ncbi:spore coat U domain-containing protein [Halomonas elongata]|uniref:Csu type fimbrial protein n=1 Tax=Halomonas elongata TaxID=2746 RepID=UPI0033529288